ncbi:MAG: transposase [Candidatus Kapabacteria bacterium]|nr:transposase [Candidatus Kapabacteria bacterium]
MNFASMGRLGLVNEKTIRRYFQTPIEFIKVHRVVIDTVLPKELPGLRVIGFDPSFLQKSGSKTPGISKFWNGSAQRAEKGLEVSVAAVIDVTRRIALPLSIAQTCPPGTPRAQKPPMEQPVEPCLPLKRERTDAATKTKTPESDKQEPWLIEEYLRHIDHLRPHLTEREQHLVFDAYFAKKKIFDQCAIWNLFCITRLRCDANMKYLYTGESRPSGRGRQKVYDGKVIWGTPREEVFEQTVLYQFELITVQKKSGFSGTDILVCAGICAASREKH